MTYTYPIDYEQFTTEEIITIVEFLDLVEQANTGKVDPVVFSKKHQEYRKVINSIAIEKQIDKAFQKVSGFSVHKTIQKYK